MTGTGDVKPLTSSSVSDTLDRSLDWVEKWHLGLVGMEVYKSYPGLAKEIGEALAEVRGFVDRLKVIFAS